MQLRPRDGVEKPCVKEEWEKAWHRDLGVTVCQHERKTGFEWEDWENLSHFFPLQRADGLASTNAEPIFPPIVWSHRSSCTLADTVGRKVLVLIELSSIHLQNQIKSISFPWDKGSSRWTHNLNGANSQKVGITMKSSKLDWRAKVENNSELKAQ